MRVGILLNGCGHRDGSEIHEAVFSMLALESLGARLQCIAPDEDQVRVIDHLNGEKSPERRNMLREAARIARGKIKPLSKIKMEDLDALMIPGGFGTALNLCDFSEKGAEMQVHPILAELIESMFLNKKAMAAICIAPVILAKVLGKHRIELTMGTDGDAARKIEDMGAIHVICPSGSCVVDTKHKIVSSPAYMYDDASMSEVFAGIQKAARELKKLF